MLKGWSRFFSTVNKKHGLKVGKTLVQGIYINGLCSSGVIICQRRKKNNVKAVIFLNNTPWKIKSSKTTFFKTCSYLPLDVCNKRITVSLSTESKYKGKSSFWQKLQTPVLQVSEMRSVHCENIQETTLFWRDVFMTIGNMLSLHSYGSYTAKAQAKLVGM